MNKWMNVPETEWDSGKGKWLANDTAELYSLCPYSDTKEDLNLLLKVIQ